MSMSYNRSKFVFSELFKNATGKTSGSGFIGVELGMIAGAGMIAGTVGYFLEVPNTLEYLGIILKLVAAATILLGVRKLSGDFNSEKIAVADATIADTAIKADIATVKAAYIAKAEKENYKPVECNRINIITMPNNFDFSQLKDIKTIEVNPQGWITSLQVEYGSSDDMNVGAYGAIPSYYWRVKGTKHTFVIPIVRIDFLSSGNYKKHFEDALETFRMDYVDWKEKGFANEWSRDYQRQFSRLIIV